jgi:hypothetical protein
MIFSHCNRILLNLLEDLWNPFQYLGNFIFKISRDSNIKLTQYKNHTFIAVCKMTHKPVRGKRPGPREIKKKRKEEKNIKSSSDCKQSTTYLS